ncbi:VIT and vWA domain-containing protein [Aestuariispira insulae]|uniref:Ca-activated chloride channel family protein n=1 Tax=Aestuariispira insulae TaxID=1461337 RepID=A0A3D9HHT4_9PROT|nr:VIT and VWA domain-containing protein [Aestuariispira insulae]RED49030.1 Ca-activated chloride channel family protein [Aestuariispira insulae]
MISLKRKLMTGICLSGLLVAGTATLTDAQAAGLLTPVHGGQAPLEIRDHKVDVVIEDGYAITTVEQVFTNPHGRDLEAVYSFPVPEKAAVSSFTYWIDGKPVQGEVMEKAEARKIYEEEKASGREAALTEQDDYKTFDISVWPVRAGQDVRIRLGYIQPTHMDTGVGRYNYPLEEGGVDPEKMSFWTSQDQVTGRFSFDLTLRNGYPIEALRLPKHPQAQITRLKDHEWKVHLDNGVRLAGYEGDGEAVAIDGGQGEIALKSQPFRLDTDIITYWRHQDGLPGSIDLITHKPEAGKRGTFMLVATPGDDLAPITKGRDWVFVLDKSGSMEGKFDTLLEGVEQALHKVPPNDRFRIVLFDSSVRELTRDFQPATEANVRSMIDLLKTVRPDNGTNLYAGMATGLKGLDADRTTGLILVTDGVANVGETEKRKFLELVQNQDVRLFTMMMGNSANRPLLTQVSSESGGTALALSNSDDIVGAIMSATSKLGHEALHDMSVDIDGVKVTSLEPQRIGSLYRGQQLVLFGHYWKGGEADVTIRAKISGRDVTYQSRFPFPETSDENPEIERLWAFAAIEGMMKDDATFGADEDRKQAVVDLSVENGIVTPYTSMIVLREEVFKQRGIDRKNKDRVESEQLAQAARAQAQVTSNRVDQQTPAFQKPRPSYSGGGTSGGGSSALGPFWAVFMALLGGVALLSRGRRK